MVDFETARSLAIDGISSTNTIEKVTISKKAKSGLTKTTELLKISVEVPVNEKIRSFDLLVDLKSDFPLSLPKIMLSEEDYESVKYIPHVESNGNICLFDQENIKLNADQPVGILKACLNQAVKIIADGLNNDRSAEFKDELVAYWGESYHPKDVIVGGFLGKGADSFTSGRVNLYYLEPSYDRINIFFTPENQTSESVVNFLKLRGHKIETGEAFYLGELTAMEPPFYFDNKSLLTFAKDNFPQNYKAAKSYINQTMGAKTLVFSVSFGSEKFGFYIYPYKKKLKGWRPQSASAVQIMTSIEPTSPVTRLSFREFSEERLRKRTDGREFLTTSYKFMLAGLGSIGSNLLHYLSALNVSEYMLVDPERMQLENVNRHLLSFNDVGRNKVDAIARYLTYNNPFLNIETYLTSVVDVIKNQIQLMNEMDVIFCAIGKDVIENYILQCLSTGLINKPVVFLWVEPYLMGAHVLYINPGTSFTLQYLEKDNFYNYNIIHKSSYDDPTIQLKLREAGCQGSYMPYGKEAITYFFTALMPVIYKLIKNPSADNLAFTFTGDFDEASALGLTLSEFASSLHSHQLIKHTI